MERNQKNFIYIIFSIKAAHRARHQVLRRGHHLLFILEI